MEQNGSSEWRLAPARLRVEENSVHIWRVYLPGERSRLTLFMNTLSSDEHAKAEKFRRPEDRISFALTRGILRCVLSKYINTAPEKIHFDYTSFGRPSLCANPEEPMLNFNVSHSNRWALFALGKNRATGIDVEYIRAGLDISSIAGRFFSPREAALIDDASEEERMRLFYKIWVRKEAYLKALGKGLSIPLNQFTVPLRSHTSVILYPGREPWLFLGISVDPDYASALVTSPPVNCIRKYHWYIEEA